MLSKPTNGWTKITIQNFEFEASCLTDIPNDFKRALIVALRDDISTSVILDGESDGECIVLFNTYNNSVHAIYDDPYCEEKTCITFWDIDIASIAKQFILDIEANKLDWEWWLCDEKPHEIDLTELKKILNNRQRAQYAFNK